MNVWLRYEAHQVVNSCLQGIMDLDLILHTKGGQISANSLLFCSLSPFLVHLLGNSDLVDGDQKALILTQFRRETVDDLLRLLTTGCLYVVNTASIHNLNELLKCLLFKIRVKKCNGAFSVVLADEDDIHQNKEPVDELDHLLSSSQNKSKDDEGSLDGEDIDIKEEDSNLDQDHLADLEDVADDNEDLPDDPEPLKPIRKPPKRKKSSEKLPVKARTPNTMEVFKNSNLVFQDHMTESTDEFICNKENCHKTFKFKFKTNAIAHIFKHLDMKPFPCDLCEQKFSNIKDLQYHKRTHDKRYKCDHCEKAFPTHSKLTVHIRVHTGEKPYVCDDCGFRTNTQGTLSIHQRMHRNEKVLECNYPDCGERFLYWPQLKRHKELEHGENSDKRCCPICNHKLKTSMDVAKHMKAKHSTEPLKEKVKRFICPVCGKGWATVLSLNNHMVSHTGEYNFQCELCHQRCKLKSQLKKHIESFHENVKSHVCDQCGKYFTSRYTLDNHSRIHSGEKPYQCTICFEKFGWHKTYRNHQEKVHGIVVEKKKRLTKNHDPTFHCSFPSCGRSFYSNYRFEIHKSKHTTKTSFQCGFCTAEFDKQQKVRDHERKRHKKYRSKKKLEESGMDPSDLTELALAEALDMHVS